MNFRFEKFLERKFFILFLSVLICFSLVNFVLAIEIVYPPVPGAEPPQIFMERIENGEIPADQALPLYIKYFYHLSLVTIGLVCFFSVVSGGVLLLIAGGSVDRMKEGKERIFVGFVGATLVLFSMAVANLINPQLLIWRIVKPEIETPPVVELPPEEEGLPTYVEIPLAGLVEAVANKAFIVNQQIQKVAEVAESINQTSQYLDTLTAQCQCNLLETQNCPNEEDSCSDALCEGDPCEEVREQIEFEISQLNLLTDQLTLQNEYLSIARRDLAISNQKLKLAEALLRDSLYPPLNYDSFIAIEDKEIERIWDYEEIDAQRNVVEYYCSPECNGDAPHERTPCCVLCPKRNVLLCFGNNYKCDAAGQGRQFCYSNGTCVTRCPEICPSDSIFPESRPGEPDRPDQWIAASELPATIQYNGLIVEVPEGGLQIRDPNVGNCWEQ